jgi:hypothetical protein
VVKKDAGVARAEILSGNRNRTVRQDGLFDPPIKLSKKPVPNSVLIKKIRQILLIYFSNGNVYYLYLLKKLNTRSAKTAT